MKLTASQEAFTQAARIISAGGVIAFRTDTFYGLGADPLNANAVARVRQLKGREETKAILLLISDASQVNRFVARSSAAFEEAARRFWPGPLTIIGVARDELPKELTAGSGTVGLRLPDDNGVCDLVRLCGGALTATSANPSGGEPARSAEEVESYFTAGIDIIIDDGDVTVTQPSTVLDLSSAEARLVREGAITRAELKEFLR